MNESLRGLSGKGRFAKDCKEEDIVNRVITFHIIMRGSINLVLIFTLFVTAVQCDILDADDEKNCVDLCMSCGGKAIFKNGICNCFVPEMDMNGQECIKRLTREVEDLEYDSSSDNPKAAERAARCSLLGSRQRLRSSDAERVASYFMSGGPITGSPFVGASNTACVSSPNEPIIGAINPGNAKPLAVQPETEKSVVPQVANGPVIVAPPHTYSSAPQSPPVVSSPANCGTVANAAYNPIIGAAQSYQPSFYPQMFSAIPQMVMAIPNAIVGAASHMSRPHIPMLGAARYHHTPMFSSLASGTQNVLQRLDKMVTPYVSQSQPKNILGARQQQTSDCSSQSSQFNIVGAPAPAATSQMNPANLQQILAHQNSLLAALSQQLGSMTHQVAAPRMQYAPVTPVQYMLAASQPMTQYSQPMAQYSPQPMAQYCPVGSSIVGSPNAPGSPSDPAPVSPKKDNTAAASDPISSDKVSQDKNSADDKIGISPSDKDVAEKMSEEAKKSQGEETQKIKRETRRRSSSRRGDAKHAKKHESHS